MPRLRPGRHRSHATASILGWFHLPSPFPTLAAPGWWRGRRDLRRIAERSPGRPGRAGKVRRGQRHTHSYRDRRRCQHPRCEFLPNSDPRLHPAWAANFHAHAVGDRRSFDDSDRDRHALSDSYPNGLRDANPDTDPHYPDGGWRRPPADRRIEARASGRSCRSRSLFVL